MSVAEIIEEAKKMTAEARAEILEFIHERERREEASERAAQGS